MFIICSFKYRENKRDVYRIKNCMNKFWESLREYPMKIINFKKQRKKLLTNKQQKPYEKGRFCYICKRKFEDKYNKDKKYHKDRNHCHYTSEYREAAHSICNLKYSIPKEIAIIFIMDLTIGIIFS